MWLVAALARGWLPGATAKRGVKEGRSRTLRPAFKSGRFRPGFEYVYLDGMRKAYVKFEHDATVGC